MRKFHSNLAFVDLLFNLLTGFVTLFIIAFLLINPVAKQGKIDPPLEFLLNVAWDNDRDIDIDIWALGPDGTKVAFIKKDGGYMVLTRDDLGQLNDRLVIDGKVQVIKKNTEQLEIRGIVPGEYIFNLHHYRDGSPGPEWNSPIDVTVELFDIKPYNKVATKTVTMQSVKSEKTVFIVQINAKGQITDVSTTGGVKLTTGGAYEED